VRAGAEPPFPPPFRDLLARILQRAGRVTGARAETARAHRRRLSQSGVFAGHRHYASGDDLRLIDWNAYARSGALYVKLLEEEERRTCTILLDCSASMTAGTPERFTGALRLAAILGGLCLRRLDGVALCGGGRSLMLSGARALGRLLEFLEDLPVGEERPLQQVQALLAQGEPGKLLWISDFADPGSFEPALVLLRRHGCRVVGWQPAVADDLQAPARGWLRLRDPETGAEVTLCVDEALADRLRIELQHLRRRQELAFLGAGYPLQRFPLPAPGDFALRPWMEAGWNFRR
jgi:uncharacterized protein (DUF58 family)